MLGTSLEKLIARSNVGFSRLLVYVSAALVAVTSVVLLVIVGLFLDLLITRGVVGPAELETDAKRQTEAADVLADLPAGKGIRPIVVRHWDTLLVGPVLRSAYARTPMLRNNASCLWFYLSTFAAAGLLLAIGLFVLDRAAQTAASQVAMSTRLAIHQQAFQVGVGEMLAAQSSRAVSLFGPLTQEMRSGLYAWWRTAPMSLGLIALLLFLALALNFLLTLVAFFLVALASLVALAARRSFEKQHLLWSGRAHMLLRSVSHQLGQSLLVAGYDLPAAPGDPPAEALRRHRQTNLKAETSFSPSRPLWVMLATISLTLLGLLVGVSVLNEPSTMSISAALLWFCTLACLVLPITRLSRLSKAVRLARSDAEEIYAYLQRPPSVNEASDAKELPGLAQHIDFNGVRLADRRGERVLDDLALKIPAGQKTAILSTNETLPATIAGLLLRFSDPAAGQVLFDGQDIRRATLPSLRRVAAYVPAGGMTFTGTIGDNIRCGENQFSDDEVVAAAKAAGIYERITEQSQGLETLVGEKGIQLTGDFAFGIGLARALLRKPALLIVEQPTGENALLQEELEKQVLAAAAGRTAIFLASRPSLLRQADQVLFFHKGHIQAAGTHAEILHESDLYRHVIYIRSNEYQDELG